MGSFRLPLALVLLLGCASKEAGEFDAGVRKTLAPPTAVSREFLEAEARYLLEVGRVPQLFGAGAVDALVKALVETLPAGASRRTLRAASTYACHEDKRPFKYDSLEGTLAGKVCDGMESDQSRYELALGFTVQDATGSISLAWTVAGNTEACPSPEGKVDGTVTATTRFAAETRTAHTRIVAGGSLRSAAVTDDEAALDHLDADSTVSLNLDATDRKPYAYSGGASARGVKNTLESLGGALTAQYHDVPRGIIQPLGFTIEATLEMLTAAEDWWRSGPCLEIRRTPDAFEPVPDEPLGIDVEVVRKQDGAAVQAKLEARAEGGTVSPATSNPAPGAPSRLVFTASAEGGAELALEATSRAGKTDRRVSAEVLGIRRLAVDELNETVTLTGSFGETPGTVTIGGVPAACETWSAAEIRCAAPAGRHGEVVVEAGGKQSRPVALTEWVVPLTFTERLSPPGMTYAATVHAECRFRGDVHWRSVAGGLKVPADPFEVYPEKTSSASYAMSQTVDSGGLHITATGEGPIGNPLHVGPASNADPPDPEFLLCEGVLNPLVPELGLSLRVFKKDGVDVTSNVGSSKADFGGWVTCVGEDQPNAIVRGTVFTLPLAGYDIPAGRLPGSSLCRWCQTEGSGQEVCGPIEQAVEWPAVKASSPPSP